MSDPFLYIPMLNDEKFLAFVEKIGFSLPKIRFDQETFDELMDGNETDEFIEYLKKKRDEIPTWDPFTFRKYQKVYFQDKKDAYISSDLLNLFTVSLNPYQMIRLLGPLLDDVDEETTISCMLEKLHDTKVTTFTVDGTKQCDLVLAYILYIRSSINNEEEPFKILLTEKCDKERYFKLSTFFPNIISEDKPREVIDDEDEMFDSMEMILSSHRMTLEERQEYMDAWSKLLEVTRKINRRLVSEQKVNYFDANYQKMIELSRRFF
jgi:hypothetical protein